MRFVSLGSGTSGNCYFLYTDTDSLLIDAGVGLRVLKKRFLNRGLNFGMIRNILVTHPHADHVKSAGSLSADYHIPVFATEKAFNGIVRNASVRRKIPQPFMHIIEEGVPFRLGPFRITPVEVPHNCPENVGYVIEEGEVTFCLMTDMGSLTPGIENAIWRSDYLVIEANYNSDMLLQGPYPDKMKKQIMSDRGHFSNEDCGRALADHASPHLRHVWLCHLSEMNNTPAIACADVKRVIEESVKEDPQRSFLKILPVEALSRKIPSEVFELK